MGEGTIYAVLIFPTPWPPSADREILSRHEDPRLMTLIADRKGRLVFSTGEAGHTPSTYRFQPIALEGSGRTILTLTWSKDQASLRLNGQDISLDEDARGEVFLLETSEDPILQGPILGGIRLHAANSDAEYVFLATLADIDRKLAEGTRYGLIRAAGLLRQLLLDSTPLVHDVNRTYHKKIEFEVIDYRTSPPLPPQAHWQNLDSSRFPGAKTITVNLEALLGAPCLELEGTRASVRDLVSACANVKGGVHLGRARTSQESALIDWDRAFTLIGEQPSLLAIAGLCRVVLRGLEPLVQEIVGSA
jgi:hypothetical protein